MNSSVVREKENFNDIYETENKGEEIQQEEQREEEDVYIEDAEEIPNENNNIIESDKRLKGMTFRPIVEEDEPDRTGKFF